jgi:hypothetical protein
MAKIGDRAIPSYRLISRDEVTNVLRVFKKYHISGGRVINMYGSAVTAVSNDPKTMNAQRKKS